MDKPYRVTVQVKIERVFHVSDEAHFTPEHEVRDLHVDVRASSIEGAVQRVGLALTRLCGQRY